MPIKGEATETWFRQDTNEMAAEWLLEDLEPGARWAYMGLKAYIKVERPSQKRHSRAQRLGYRAAARRWNVTPEDVETMEAAAIKAGKLVIEGDEWVLTDLAVCAHEDTAKRNAAKTPQIAEIEREPEQTGANEEPADICAANGSKSEQKGAPCHATVTETETVIQPTVEEGGSAGARKTVPADGEAHWGHFSEPMRSVGLMLCRANALLESGPPTERDVKSHLREDDGARQLIDDPEFGVDGGAQLYAWTIKHKTGNWSYNSVARSRVQLRYQMLNGVKFEPRSSASAPALDDKKKAMSRELLKRRLEDGSLTPEQYQYAISGGVSNAAA